jgi:hypothetical protein
MKIFGLLPRWVIQRNCAILLLKLKPVETLKYIVDTTIEEVPVGIYYPLNNKNELLPADYHGGAFYRGSVGKYIFLYFNFFVNLFLDRNISSNDNSFIVFVWFCSERGKVKGESLPKLRRNSL